MTRYSYLIFRAHERVWKRVSALVEITGQFNGGLPFLVVVFYVVNVWFVFSYMAGKEANGYKRYARSYAKSFYMYSFFLSSKQPCTFLENHAFLGHIISILQIEKLEIERFGNG